MNADILGGKPPSVFFYALAGGSALACALVLLASCQLPIQVPEEARLLYFGPVTDAKQIDQVLPTDELEDSPRQIYLYDEDLKKVVAVRTVDAKHRDLDFVWDPTHRYRVYIL